jgi:hypothetical protein
MCSVTESAKGVPSRLVNSKLMSIPAAVLQYAYSKHCSHSNQAWQAVASYLCCTYPCSALTFGALWKDKHKNDFRLHHTSSQYTCNPVYSCSMCFFLLLPCASMYNEEFTVKCEQASLLLSAQFLANPAHLRITLHNFVHFVL